MSKLTYAGENGKATFQKVVANNTGAIVPEDQSILAAEFHNQSASVNLWIYHLPNAFAAAVTNGNGRRVGPNESWTDAASRGPWYLYAASGTVDVTVTIAREINNAAAFRLPTG